MTARVTPLGLTLDVDNASLTLDEGWSPYAQAQLVCKFPDAAGMEALDLRTIPLSVDLRARQDSAHPGHWPGSPLTVSAAWPRSRPRLAASHSGSRLHEVLAPVEHVRTPALDESPL